MEVDYAEQHRNLFAYHGGKKNPNIETWDNSYEREQDPKTNSMPCYLEMNNVKLTINGQPRHLDGTGLDRRYLMERIMPQLHTNTSDVHGRVHNTNGDAHGYHDDFATLSELVDRKEIYAFPFSIAPESQNPAGALNFSKVSHANFEVTFTGYAPGVTSSITDDYQIDVYGVYFNWLCIKEGRAMLTFA